MDIRDEFERFGVNSNAFRGLSFEDGAALAKALYKLQSKLTHPDRLGSLSTDEKSIVIERYKEVQESFSALDSDSGGVESSIQKLLNPDPHSAAGLTDEFSAKVKDAQAETAQTLSALLKLLAYPVRSKEFTVKNLVGSTIQLFDLTRALNFAAYTSEELGELQIVRSSELQARLNKDRWAEQRMRERRVRFEKEYTSNVEVLEGKLVRIDGQGNRFSRSRTLIGTIELDSLRAVGLTFEKLFFSAGFSEDRIQAKHPQYMTIPSDRAFKTDDITPGQFAILARFMTPNVKAHKLYPPIMDDSPHPASCLVSFNGESFAVEGLVLKIDKPKGVK